MPPLSRNQCVVRLQSWRYCSLPCIRESQISLLRYPLTLPRPPAPQTSLHDFCVPSAGTGETIDVKNVPCRFAVSIAEVSTMKRDANDASFERNHIIPPYFSLIPVSSRTSVFQPCCRLPATVTLTSLLDCRHEERTCALGNSSLPGHILSGGRCQRIRCAISGSSTIRLPLVRYRLYSRFCGSCIMFHISLYV